MLLLDCFIGITGLVLSGDSLGRGIRSKNLKILTIGGIQIAIGLYFLVAAIGYH